MSEICSIILNTVIKTEIGKEKLLLSGHAKKGGSYVAIVDDDISIIYDGLINKFLYKNDINCIHILLNLFDLEEDITNICPKYITTNKLKKRILTYLKDRKDNHFISLTIGQLLHEDINRLELFVYLEGYRQGYYNNYWANRLEKGVLMNNQSEDLYNRKYLYHFETSEEEIKSVKANMYREIDEKEENNNYLFDTILEYSSSIFKAKIFNLNNYLDKQLTIDYNSKSHNITEDEDLLKIGDLNNIYKETIKVVFRNSLNLYKEAYWYGLNDRVLKRYH